MLTEHGEAGPAIDCSNCGCKVSTIIETPKGPHYAKFLCDNCGKFHGWMPKPDADKVRRSAGHRNLVKKYGKGYCELCLRSEDEAGRETTGHHVIEHKDGGGNERENVWILCVGCHRLVHHMRNYHGFNQPPGAR